MVGAAVADALGGIGDCAPARGPLPGDDGDVDGDGSRRDRKSVV